MSSRTRDPLKDKAWTLKTKLETDTSAQNVEKGMLDGAIKFDTLGDYVSNDILDVLSDYNIILSTGSSWDWIVIIQ